MDGIAFFCPRWGEEGATWEAFSANAKSAGYDGIEVGIAKDTTEGEMDGLWEAAEKQQLAIILQHYDTTETDFSKHYDTYANWFRKIAGYPAVKVNSQTGRDFFDYQQNKLLIELADTFADASGIPVFHETHRSKFSFAAHITQTYLSGIPDLRLTLDVSHWVCVAESYLADQREALDLAIRRTGHLHARVGYPEGPQVSDPRLAEWQEALGEHLNWWDQVVSLWKHQQNRSMTITPEFGPAPYMVHHPETGRPLGIQWEINRYMMELLKNRYSGAYQK